MNAGSQNGVVSFQIVKGAEKYQGSLQKGNKIKDLYKVVEALTSIPIPCQKLIHQGRSLNDLESTLEKYNIRNGSKIMLLAKIADFETDPNYIAICDVEKSYFSSKKKISDLNEDIKGIEKGYLDCTLIKDALNKINKKVKGVAEELFKQLVQLDSLTLGESYEECKSKRKTVVKKIQSCIDEADKMQENIEKLIVLYCNN